MFNEGGNRICSPELLAQIAEVIDSAVVITKFGSLGQFDHRIIYANPAFTKLTGYKNNEIIGRSPDVLCDPRTSGDKIIEFYTRCAHGGKFAVEIDSFKKLGSEIKLRMEVTPVIDETQGVNYYILFLKDLAQAEIRAAMPESFGSRPTYAYQPREEQEPAPALKPQYHFEVPPVAAVKPAAKVEEEVFQFQTQYHPEPQTQPQSQPVQQAVPPKKFDERYWLSPNNDLTPHSTHSAAEDDALPKVPAEISTDESIAEYCKTQFLANMSHDLRTPLNAIIGFSEVIKDQLFGPIDNSRYVSYANDIFKSGQELFATISEIMELSEIAPDEDLSENERMNICDVIESVIDVLSPKAFEADVKIIKSLNVHELRLKGDRRKIKQAVAGVINNAIKYSDKASKIEISANLNEKGDLKLVVYARSANIMPARGGNGLMGTITKKAESEYPEISLAKRFIEAHEGKFAIFNSAISGTEIAITLPATRLSMEQEKKTLLKVIS